MTHCMEEYEDKNLIPGFRCEPIPELEEWDLDDPERRYMGEVEMGNKILMGSEFEAWDEFDSFTSNIANKLYEVLLRKGCHMGNEDRNHCSGEFRNQACRQGTCHGMTGYKGATKERPSAYYGNLRRRLYLYIFDQFEPLAHALCPAWKGSATSHYKVVNTQIIYPVLAIRQEPNRSKPVGVVYNYENVVPDVIFDLFSPNRNSLLPDTTTSTTLASAYSRSCTGINEHTELSYDQKCMARVVKSAMFTRSGYGCLFTHNQAVFLRVSPDVSHIESKAMLKHKVSVSREYKCDGDISVFHGLLALMVRGFEVSSDKSERMYREYFRLLEASEVSEERELVISDGRNKGRKRKADDTTSFLSNDAKEHRDVDKHDPMGETMGERGACFARFYPAASDEAHEQVKTAVQGGKPALLSQLDMVRMFMLHSRVIDNGGSGVLWETQVEGLKVAVKKWNREKDYGLAWLLKEIVVYKWLAAWKPELMGRVVPRVIATCEETLKESALAMEFVGSMPHTVWPDADAVRKNERKGDNGGPDWYVDDEKLTDWDIREIEKSAVEGLKKLHDCGIIHGDPRPANLRVERIRREGVTSGWRTWWIDLGLVKLLEEEKFGDLTFISSVSDQGDLFPFEWRNYKPSFKLESEF